MKYSVQLLRVVGAGNTKSRKGGVSPPWNFLLLLVIDGK